MKALPAPKKPARAPRKAGGVRLTNVIPTKRVPPPGRKASEVADLLPPPAADFDAPAVEAVVAGRSRR